MLMAHTSLQESIDDEEKETESEEGLLEERKKQMTSYYSLYVYDTSRSLQQGVDSDDGSPTTAETLSLDDFSLSLVDTNLPAEGEPGLRSFIAKRLSKGSLFEGMGNVASVELSLPEYALGCYYCLFQPENPFEKTAPDSNSQPPEYVICFLGGSEKGLELFRLELDKYTEGLKNNLDPEMCNLEIFVKPYLHNWFEDCVLPIQRTVQLFQEQLVSLLHTALSYTPVEVQESDDRTKKDIDRFLSAASLQGLVQEGTMTLLCMAMTEEQHKSVIINCRGPTPQFYNAGRNKFCEDWMQAFLNYAEGGNPFLFRQKLESFKLKATQDLNNLKRFIRQAEMSHYALFKCYMFLKNCGNGDVLLRIVKVEYAEMPEANNVVKVLEEFMYEEAALSSVS